MPLLDSSWVISNWPSRSFVSRRCNLSGASYVLRVRERRSNELPQMRVLQILRAAHLDVPDYLALTHQHSLGVLELRAAGEHQVDALGIDHHLNKCGRHPTG